MSKGITIRDIAGFCPEEAIWKMMADVSEVLIKEQVGYAMTPESIVIDGDAFMVGTEQEIENEFMAPEHIEGCRNETSQMVWSLGALAYYMATGHIIFGGNGGYYQKEHPTVPLPILPKGLQALSSVMQKCLNYDPNDRVCLKELNELSHQGLLACKKRQREKSVLTAKGQKTGGKYNGDKWPEEMTEV